MNQMVARLYRDTKGAALVEYGMLIGLIAVICIVAVTTLGQDVSAVFSNIAAQLSGV